MRNYYYNSREKWLRLLIGLLVILVVILCIFAISKCSNSHKSEKPPLYTETEGVEDDSNPTDDTSGVDNTSDDNVEVVESDLDSTLWAQEICADDSASAGPVLAITQPAETTKEEIDGSQKEQHTEDDPHECNDDRGELVEMDPDDDSDHCDNTDDDDSGFVPEEGGTDIYPPLKEVSPDNSGDDNYYSPPGKDPGNDDSYDNPPKGRRPPFDGNLLAKRNRPSGLLLLIILLIVYIFSTMMSRGGVLVIWAGPLDKALVIIAAILYFISELQIALLSFSILLMLISFVLSFLANAGNILNIILSILSKLFFFFLVNFSLVVIIVVLMVCFMIRVAKHSRDY